MKKLSIFQILLNSDLSSSNHNQDTSNLNMTNQDKNVVNPNPIYNQQYQPNLPVDQVNLSQPVYLGN